MPASPKPTPVPPLALFLALAVAGCGSDEEAPPPRPSAPASTPSAAETDPLIQSLELVSDPAVIDLGRRVAWFFATGKRLPADRAEVESFVRVAEWGPLPRATADGRPIGYHPTGPRTFEIRVGPPSSGSEVGGSAPSPRDEPGRTVVIPVDIPPDLPTAMGPRAFSTWWELEFRRQALVRIRKRLAERVKAATRPPNAPQ